MQIIPGIRCRMFPRIELPFHLRQPAEAPATERSPSIAGSLLLDDHGSSCPQRFARTIRHAIDCVKLGSFSHQRSFKLFCRKPPWTRGAYAAVARPPIMFSAINSGKVLVLVFACVILYAGSCSGGSIKDAASACGARWAEILPTIVLSCFPCFILIAFRHKSFDSTYESFSIYGLGI